MLRLDIPARDELTALLAHRGPDSVTIYLPTTPLSQQAEADPIARNPAAEVVRRLEVAGVDKRRGGALAERLDELVDDDAFRRL